MKKRTHNEFVEEMNSINNNIIVRGKFQNVSTKIDVECRICGNKWKTTPHILLCGSGCPKCATKKNRNTKRITNEDFLSKVKKNHSDLLLESEYINNYTKIKVKCLECGREWCGLPKDIVKCGCSYCRLYGKKAQQRFIEKMNAINPNIEVIGKYVGRSKRIEVKCKKCGKVWSPIAESILSGSGCLECSNKNGAIKRKITHEQFENKLEIKSPSLKLISKYKGMYEPIKAQCLNCGKIWSDKPIYLLNKKYCNECANKLRIRKPSITNEQFLDRLKANNINNIVIKSKYEGINKNIMVHFIECNHTVPITPYNLIKRGRCPICNGTKVKTQKEFEEDLKRINKNIKVIGDYISSSKRIKVECKVCGNVWNPVAYDLMLGRGCPKCNHSSTSFAEQLIYNSFKEVLGEEKVISRDRKTINKELDIYIPNEKIAIEIGSWYWHKNRFDVDKQKRELCKKNGIRLITIYDGYNEKDKPFNNDCFVYDNNIGLKKNNKELKELVYELFKLCKIDCAFDNEKWSTLINEAYNKSRKKTTKEFIKEMEIINPNIEIIGEYKSNREPIECRCKKCGRLYSRSPYHLLLGEKCKKCTMMERSKKVRNIDTDEVFLNAKEAAIKYNCSSKIISAVCSKSRKTAKGYRWEYVE